MKQRHDCRLFAGSAVSQVRGPVNRVVKCKTPGSASDPGALRDDCSSAPLDVVAANVPSRSAAPRTRPKVQLVRTRMTKPVVGGLSRPETNRGCFCATAVSVQQQRLPRLPVEMNGR